MSDEPSVPVTSPVTQAGELLPWSALRERSPLPPWAELRRIAEAVSQTPTLVERLSRMHREATAKPYEEQGMEWLSVPTIFALAGPKSVHEPRMAMARSMIGMLERVDGDSDFEFETLERAIGRQGAAAVIPLVIAAIRSTSPKSHLWTILWSLLDLVRETRDPLLRRSVAELARETLDSIERGGMEFSCAEWVAYVLQACKDADSVPALRRLLSRKKNAAAFLDRSTRSSLTRAIEVITGARPDDAFTPLWARSLKDDVDRYWASTTVVDETEEPGPTGSESPALDVSGPEIPIEPAVATDIDADAFSPELVERLVTMQYSVQTSADTDEPAPGAKKIGRNDKCPCGSGRRYRRCCGRDR